MESRTKVLILQHPREAKEPLSSVPLILEVLPATVLRVGFSWGNLQKAFRSPVDPKTWAVLYVGTKKDAEKLKGRRSAVLADKKGNPLDDDLGKLEGIILLDGNWRQAKALWWRNPWLLKLRRLMLFPETRSLYGNLRKEPRKETVSTLEALALALREIEGEPGCDQVLLERFKEFLKEKISPNH